MVAKKPRVVVVGAGISCLTAAHRLCGAGGEEFEVAVVEAGDRVDCRILTSEFAGHRVEMGATWAARSAGGGGKELEEVEEALLAMHINLERTDTSADDLDLTTEGEYRDFPNPEQAFFFCH
uniref:Amine oxidase domain-containing protein n=1 Tax=Oryza barthii TaxID=65489 RepID=A0A0D3F878_9ORYZ